MKTESSRKRLKPRISRFGARFPRVRVKRARDKSSPEANLLNLSSTGLSFFRHTPEEKNAGSTPDFFTVNDLVHLEMKVPGIGKIQATARIIWGEKKDGGILYGARFSSMASKIQLKIDKQAHANVMSGLVGGDPLDEVRTASMSAVPNDPDSTLPMLTEMLKDLWCQVTTGTGEGSLYRYKPLSHLSDFVSESVDGRQI